MTSCNGVRARLSAAAVALAAVAAGAVPTAAAQGRTTRQGEPPNVTAGGGTDWTSHNLDLANSRYSELDEIRVETVGRLAERWSYRVAAGIDVSQVTPLVVDGVMYFHAGAAVVAVNAVTGEEVWTLELDEARRNRVRGPTWAEGKIYSYNGPNLVAADAKTGELVASYGDGGVLPVVGLALQAKYPDTYPPTLDPHTLGYRITAAPAYHDGTLYVGAALSEGHIPGGLVIATDAETGAVEWVFNTIPQRPRDDGWEIARDTWGDGQRAGGGVWTQPAIDLDLGLIYFNTGNPSPDYDGSARPGANLFTNATVALDLETGRCAGTTRRSTTTCGTGTTSPARCSSTSRAPTARRSGASARPARTACSTSGTGRPASRSTRWWRRRCRPRPTCRARWSIRPSRSPTTPAACR